MSDKKEKRKILLGPADGYIIRCERDELRMVLNKVNAELVAIYRWDSERKSYYHQGTFEPEELSKANSKNSVTINIFPVKYGVMYSPNPYNQEYNAYCWLIEGDKI